MCDDDITGGYHCGLTCGCAHSAISSNDTTSALRAHCYDIGGDLPPPTGRTPLALALPLPLPFMPA